MIVSNCGFGRGYAAKLYIAVKWFSIMVAMLIHARPQDHYIIAIIAITDRNSEPYRCE
jgi:hypothetical protein